MARPRIYPVPIQSTHAVDPEASNAANPVAARWRSIIEDLSTQLGGSLTTSQALQVRRAATLSILLDRDEMAILSGKAVDEQNMRLNVKALNAVMIGLGVAKKSRDITKADARSLDLHAAAVLDAAIDNPG